MSKIKVKPPTEQNLRPQKHPNRLAFQRRKSRLTQKEVAKLLDYDFTTISRHESGDRALDAEDIKNYAKLYKVETYELFQDSLPQRSA